MWSISYYVKRKSRDESGRKVDKTRQREHGTHFPFRIREETLSIVYWLFDIVICERKSRNEKEKKKVKEKKKICKTEIFRKIPQVQRNDPSKQLLIYI